MKEEGKAMTRASAASVDYAAERIVATVRMLLRLQARLEGRASGPALSAMKRLQEAIGDLTRLELKMRGRRWHAPQDVPDR